MPINVVLDVVMARRRIRGTELAKRVGITPANLSKLRTNRVLAVRFSTLEALCRELECQPGDLLVYVDPAAAREPASRGDAAQGSG